MAVNYEYYVLSSNGLHGSDLSNKLNSLGKNGWEYVQGFQSTYGAGTNEIIFRRPSLPTTNDIGTARQQENKELKHYATEEEFFRDHPDFSLA